jgi:hypothetical protein
MANYSNQLRINLTNFEKIAHKEKDGNRFIQPINFKYEAAAMRNLNGNAFKLWRYFLRWYGKDHFFFSPAAVRKELGLGENGATTARKELETKGYLTSVEGKNNTYVFTPVLPIDYEKLKNTRDLDEN